MLRALLLLLMPSILFAEAVPGRWPGHWSFFRTPDQKADGEALRVFLINGTDLYDPIHYGRPLWTCGNVLEIEPGVYPARIFDFVGYGSMPFLLPAQQNCNGRRTEIIPCARLEAGDCRMTLAGIPSQPSVKDLPGMWVLQASRSPFGGGSVLMNNGPTNNYILRGFGVTTDPEFSRIDHWFYQPFLVSFGSSSGSITTDLSQYSHDIELDHFWVGPGEEIAYGPMVGNQNPDAYFRSVVGAVAVGGQDFWIHDGTAISGGFNPTNPNTAGISGCVPAGDRTICTSLGIAAKFGLQAVACPNGSDSTCMAAGASHLAVLGGASPAWAALNGVHNVYYVSADSLGIDSAYRLNAWIPSHLNSSTFGPFAGSVTARWGQSMDPEYSFTTGYLENSLLERLLLSGGWPFFSGGGGPATDYGVIQPGSTKDSLIISHITGRAPVVGDLIGLDVDPAGGPSKWCGHGPTSGVSCGGSAHYRVGKVTAVNGNNYAVVPHGPDGIDVPPLTGISCPLYSTDGVVLIAPTGNPCTAQWDGKQSLENVAIMNNTFYTSIHSHPYGKTFFEAKSAKNVAVNGNRFTNAYGGPFIDVVAQSSGGTNTGLNAPWTSAVNLHFSNNLLGGQWGSSPGFAMRGEYYENTSKYGTNSWFENNLAPEATIFTNAAAYISAGGGMTGGLAHNTVTISSRSIYWWQWYYNGSEADQCPTGRYFAPYGGPIRPGWFMRDNILPFGLGPYVPNCWPGYQDAVIGNAFTNESVNPYPDSNGLVQGFYLTDVQKIRDAYPKSRASSLINLKLAGACTYDHIENCALAADSPFRGTAADGGDPGADILKLKDHLNRWSLDAGLIRLDLGRMTGGYESQWVLDPRAWQFHGATISASFPANSCTVKLYKDRARIFEATGITSCAVKAGIATASFGPLEHGATYYPVLSDSNRVMVAVPFKSDGVSIFSPTALEVATQ